MHLKGASLLSNEWGGVQNVVEEIFQILGRRMQDVLRVASELHVLFGFVFRLVGLGWGKAEAAEVQKFPEAERIECRDDLASCQFSALRLDERGR